jgi:hypothetical protein
LAGEKESFFDAAILIFSPLAGLRPSRSGEALTLNFPNPTPSHARVPTLRSQGAMFWQQFIHIYVELIFGCDNFK